MTENTCSAIERHAGTTVQGQGQTKTGSVTYRPQLDLFALDDRYEIEVELPGATRDSIDVTVEDGVLTIEARVPERYPESAAAVHFEFGVGDFRRQVRLGEDIDRDGLEASFADGVLTLRLPRLAERRPRRIEVTDG